MRTSPLLILAVLGSLWSGTASFAQAPPAVPALPDTERRTSYALSASTCPACSVGFALYGDSTDYGSWIEVWLTTGTGSTTASTLLTAVTDYTLSSATGSLATIPRPITDATITLSTARTGTLQIVGARRPRRTAQFAENRGVAARDLNQVLTDIISSNRETWDRTKDISARALLTAPGDTVGLLPATAVRAGGILAFDSSGNPTIVAAGSSGTANVVGPNVSVVGHIATFGNTTGTLLLDGGLVGAGDFVGPGSSTVNHAVTFAGSTGKIGKDSGLTLTPSTGTITITNAKTLTIDNSLELAGTDGTVMTFPTTSATLARTDAANIFTGHQTIEGVTTTGATGTGNLVFSNAPTFSGITTTSINGLGITAGAGATLTIAAGKALTDTSGIGASVLLGAAGGGFAAYAGGSCTNQFIRSLSAAAVPTCASVANADLTNSSLTIGSTNVALGATAATVAGLTLTAPTINGGTAQALTNLGIRSSGSAFDMVVANTEVLTAQRQLTVTLNNAARALNISGDITTAAAFTTSGGAITLTATGATNVTLPTSGTLATINTAQTFSGANIFSATQQFTDIKLSSGKIYPTSDGTTALQITKADAATRIVNFDTTNARVGINKTAGAFDLDVNGAANVGGALTFGTATITGLTVNNSPSATNDYLLYYSLADGAIRRCTVGSCAAAATAGVSSLNGLTGGLSIVAGTNITVSAGGSSVTVNNDGVLTIAGNKGAFTLANGIDNSTNQIQLTAARRTLPTVQKFTSGSGTYTTPANVLWIEVLLCGGGGGGAGSGTVVGTPGTAATAGGNSTFGTTLLVANGGAGAGNYVTSTSDSTGGAGGSASLGAGIGDAVTGGNGTGGSQSVAATGQNGGPGAASALGGVGGGGPAGVAGYAAATNSCSGGGGAGVGQNSFSGGGGGAGAYVNAIINTPSATYSYAVGAAGAAGAAGTSGTAGGAGGAGYIRVTEHYGT